MRSIQICLEVIAKSSEIFILITPGPAWPFIIHWSVLGPAHKWQADVVSTPSRTPTHSGIRSLTGLPSGFRHVPTLIVVHDVILLPPPLSLISSSTLALALSSTNGYSSVSILRSYICHTTIKPGYLLRQNINIGHPNEA